MCYVEHGSCVVLSLKDQKEKVNPEGHKQEVWRG